MTCIIGFVDKGNVYIGGDAAGCSDWEVRPISEPKVFRRDDMIFGMAGSIRAAQLIHYKLSLAPRAENIADMEYLVESFAEDVRACLKAGGVAHVENNVEEGNGFLLGYNGVLYFVDDDYQITSFGDNMQAIGAGRQYALGAMVGYANLSPRERIIASLEASARFCAAVCPPWTVEVLGNGKEE